MSVDSMYRKTLRMCFSMPNDKNRALWFDPNYFCWCNGTLRGCDYRYLLNQLKNLTNQISRKIVHVAMNGQPDIKLFILYV